MPLPKSAFGIFNLPPGLRSIELCGWGWLSINRKKRGEDWKSTNFPARCKSWHCPHCGQRHRNKLKKLLLELMAKLEATALFYGFIDDCSLSTARRTVNRAKGFYFSAALKDDRRLFITTANPSRGRTLSRLTDWAEVDHLGIEQLIEETLQPENLAPFGNGKKKNGIVTHSRNFGGTFYKPRKDRSMSEEISLTITGDSTHRLTPAVLEEVLHEAGAYKRTSEEVGGDPIVDGAGADPNLMARLLRHRGFTVRVLSKSSSRTNNCYKGRKATKSGTAQGGITSGP